MATMFWHDYETFGSDARRDRPCQFAGIRTDLELNVIDDPVEIFCRPAPDFLPDPRACLITGITPQVALARGLPEVEFCRRIAEELATPDTCGVGYNSVRFDDEITRRLLYRNFYDPYEREWQKGNSRWDLIDVLRMTYALRPEGIEWPSHEDGTPSFRLEQLTAANGIAHADAHDAVADVRATIALARLLRQRQPRLYDFLFQLRSKQRVLQLLDLSRQPTLVHVSRMFAARRACLSLVVPVCLHPSENNGVVVVDLLQDPADLLACSAEELRSRLYKPSAALAPGEQRLPLKTVHINRCPALAPLSVVTAEVSDRLGLDLELVERRRQQILGARTFTATLGEALKGAERSPAEDVDLALYEGFLGDHDKRLCQQLRSSRSADLAAFAQRFKDARLPELLFRLRARNYPESLDAAERERWAALCRDRLLGLVPGAGLSGAEFAKQVAVLREEGADARLLEQLLQYAQEVAGACGLVGPLPWQAFIA